MVVLKYDANLLGYMNSFKQMTNVDLRDCFIVNDHIIFVTEAGKAGLAIGKEGKNIQSLRHAFNKDIKIMEHSEDPLSLVKSYLFPLKPAKVELVDDKTSTGDLKVINIKFSNARERRVLLGENQTKLKLLKEIVARYYKEISNIIVLQ